MCDSTIRRFGACTVGTLLLVAGLAGCDGNDDEPRPPIQNPPPVTDLVWNQGDWDELDWQ